MCSIQLPADVQMIISRLNKAGHTAYAVGGCVRDQILGQPPKDWDICTSAKPDEMLQVLNCWHLVETGLKHGTITVVIHGEPYEVTTYRVDGTYTDHRHPDGVTFVTDVREDLARRDFTINAMAYHPEEGLIDAFGGQADLKNGIIRCVGNAADRFEEDALRIMRALRFASTYGFHLDDDLLQAAHRLAPTLSRVAGERLHAQLSRLLCGNGAETILREAPDIIGVFIPQLLPSVGFEQHTHHHRYNVWEHTIRSIASVSPDPVLRYTMLFHDLGKPFTFSQDENGGHFYGHPKVSCQIAESVMTRLHFDTASYRMICQLVLHHDGPLEADEHMLLKMLNKYGEETLRMLIEVHRADQLAKGTLPHDAIHAFFDSICAALDELLSHKPCFTLKSLAISGNDLLALGLKGPAVGQMLNTLLDEVMEQRLSNDHEALMSHAAALKKI